MKTEQLNLCQLGNNLKKKKNRQIERSSAMRSLNINKVSRIFSRKYFVKKFVKLKLNVVIVDSTEEMLVDEGPNQF